MKTKKRLQDYTWEELLEATSGKEGYKEAGRTSGEYTLENKLGIHTDDEELRREWSSMGGEASIDKLLEWQKENNHLEKLHKLERTDEWKQNISNGNKGKKIPNDVRERISKTVIENNSKLSDDELSEKYKNKKPNDRHLILRKKILDSIPTDTFITSIARKACNEFGLDNWKGFLKDKRIITQLHRGTNQSNPSIYKKIV